VVVAVALISGCTVVKGTISTISSLQKAGFENPQINTSESAINVNVGCKGDDLDAAAKEAARIVWLELPLPIEALSVVCRNGFGGSGTFSQSRDELEETFGARPAKLDEPVNEDDIRNVAIGVAIAGVVGLLILAGIIVAIVLLVRRNRRNRQPPPGYPGHPGYPQPPQPPYPPPP
jgi:hypothetical protein